MQHVPLCRCRGRGSAAAVAAKALMEHPAMGCMCTCRHRGGCVGCSAATLTTLSLPMAPSLRIRRGRPPSWFLGLVLNLIYMCSMPELY